MVTIVVASTEEYDDLGKFLLENGKNEWNFLPEDGVAATIATIAEGGGEIVTAREGDKVIGIGMYLFPETIPSCWSKYTESKVACFVAEMCVHRDHTGKGVGTRLLNELSSRAANSKYAPQILLLDRHEDNAASAGMMRKAGCTVVDTYDDHTKRPTGSRMTTVLQKDLSVIRDPML